MEVPVPRNPLLTSPALSSQRSLLGPGEWGQSLTALSSPHGHPGAVILPRALPVKPEGSQWVTVKSHDGD